MPGSTHIQRYRRGLWFRHEKTATTRARDGDVVAVVGFKVRARRRFQTRLIHAVVVAAAVILRCCCIFLSSLCVSREKGPHNRPCLVLSYSPMQIRGTHTHGKSAQTFIFFFFFRPAFPYLSSPLLSFMHANTRPRAWIWKRRERGTHFVCRFRF